MKILLFSHESDIDGIGSVILGKLAFSNIDYELLPNPGPLELKFREYINNKKIYDYDKIYVTDLALGNPSLEMVSNDDILKERVKVFDHHERAIQEGLNKYDFTFIEEVDSEGTKRCGTEIFYKYLLDNKFLNRTKSLDEFVEFTRLEDTWDWKKQNITEAHDLALLFNSIGIEKYINLMLKKLNNNDFNLNEEYELIQSIKEEDINNIKKYLSEAEYFIDEDGNKYGITFSPYKYRNDLPEYVRNNNIEDIKYFITVSLDKDKFGQKSYRSIDRTCDVNRIAMKYNGGGHPCSAGVSITEEQNKKISSLSKREALEFLANSSYKNI